MKFRKSIPLLSGVCIGMTLNANAAELRTVEKPIEGSYIVVLKKSQFPLNGNGPLRMRESRDFALEMAARHRFRFSHVYDHALRGFAVKADDRALAQILADPRVEYVEEDSEMTQEATQSGASWNLQRIAQNVKLVPASSYSYTYIQTGSGVNAYVIDSGVTASHVDLAGRVRTGYNAITGTTNTSDCNFHGTAVASLIGGKVAGVAKSVNIHPVKVTGCDGRPVGSSVLAGLNWVIANVRKPAVVNISLSGGGSAIDTALRTLHNNKGVPVVVAAGNRGNPDVCTDSLARVAETIAVGASTINDSRWIGSNYGSCLDLFAPGDMVRYARHDIVDRYAFGSGTSWATPQVAGVAAQILQRYPTASPTTVRNMIVGNATPNKLSNIGSGSPNKLLFTKSW